MLQKHHSFESRPSPTRPELARARLSKAVSSLQVDLLRTRWVSVATMILSMLLQTNTSGVCEQQRRQHAILPAPAHSSSTSAILG